MTEKPSPEQGPIVGSMRLEASSPTEVYEMQDRYGEWFAARQARYEEAGRNRSKMEQAEYPFELEVITFAKNGSAIPSPEHMTYLHRQAEFEHVRRGHKPSPELMERMHALGRVEDRLRSASKKVPLEGSRDQG